MKFTKLNNGNIKVSEIFPNASNTYDIYVYKHAGNQYTFSAGEIGIRMAHLEANSDEEACIIIANKINDTLDNLYNLLSERAKVKEVKDTTFIPIVEYVSA